MIYHTTVLKKKKKPKVSILLSGKEDVNVKNVSGIKRGQVIKRASQSRMLLHKIAEIQNV